MRHNYKSHGKHCYLRSFKTKCRKCGDDVLYWECTHGSKLYFNYPPYGKLVRHYCRKVPDENQKKKKEIIVKRPIGIDNKESPRCLVCGKMFKSAQDLEQHFNQLKKSDYLHQLFSDSAISPKQEKSEENSEYQPKFGRINIKKKEQKK
ncbi:MAG: hypothetical protein JW891_01155 [Candidatus Lokiarchaeota archaeon]|nr:hypothetical protein [Candidatus Lokiarchaeota archaeon]